MILNGHLSKITERPANGTFPQSWSLTVLDADKGETLRLSATREVAQALAGVAPFSPIALRVDWFAVQNERGTTYRLRAVGVQKSGTTGADRAPAVPHE